MNAERVEKPILAYNLEEAAEATGYSVGTLRIAIRRNDLLARYANTKAIILADELQEWLRSLPTEPKGGHAPLSSLVEDDPEWPGPFDRTPIPAEPRYERSAKAVFWTPEEVAPELGVSKSALRQFAKQTGFHSRVGKRIMLHADDVTQLVAWMRERQDKKDQWWVEPEKDPWS
ncbi:hypothetical protein AOC05_04820 [Arthrobacter alpinus]|uniref:Helix-turn-helix domain-containing protein n=1 Tax=Arthrobacter alpinus TaxID=656366 RepID=A0A0M4QLM3_9MICC|nr:MULTISPECIES: DNA-binding protein [Arthrobacter]ALE91797.1 hypothetical protein AOC05_04820 [Arthrobacter alpinus]